MTTFRLAKIISKGNGKTPEEALEILQRRKRNIERYGYEEAFKREIKLSGGKKNER